MCCAMRQTEAPYRVQEHSQPTMFKVLVSKVVIK